MFLDPPLNSTSYAHRQGDLAVQLPAGAHDLRLKLLKHEGFVFGTAFSPETVAGEGTSGSTRMQAAQTPAQRQWQDLQRSWSPADFAGLSQQKRWLTSSSWCFQAALPTPFM